MADAGSAAAVVAAPRRPRRALRAALAVPPLLTLVAIWLVASTSGLQLAAALAGQLSGGRLSIEQAEGSLLGPLKFGRLSWSDGADRIVAERVEVDLRAGELMHGRVHLTRLAMDKLALDLAPSDQPAQLPGDLALPFDLRVDRAEIGELRSGDTVLATALAASLLSEDGRHRIDGLRASIAGLTVGASGAIDATRPFALEAKGWLQGNVAEQPLRLDLQAAGTLDAIDLKLASATPALRGAADAMLRPFAELPVARLNVDLAGLDPAAWMAGAPGATLDLAADLRSAGDAATLAGEFSLRNRKPGVLDRQRLPFTALAGRLRWRPADIALSRLDAALAGGGRLRGKGAWQAGELSLDLRAEAVDAAALHGALRHSRLGGDIDLRLGAERQSVRLDLADPRYAFKARATRAGDALRLDELLVRAGDAQLRASGEAATGGEAFAVRGELARFDPARFVDLPQLPTASINARFDAKGRWRPQLQLDGQFELRDSQLAGKPCAGRGDIGIDGARVRRLDLHLAAGANRLDTEGAFGRAGESLTLALAAPELAPYGFEGGLAGVAHLSGTAAEPVFDLHLATQRFGLPGSFTLKGLELAAAAGDELAKDVTVGAASSSAGKAGTPLRLNLRLAGIDRAERPDQMRDVAINIDGTRAEHTLSASAVLAGQGRLSLVAQGGLAADNEAPRWRGSLTELDLRGGPPGRTLHLAQAAPLQLAADGGTLGPAHLVGDGWQGRLDAGVDSARINLAFEAAGSRLGQLSASLVASAAAPWRLDEAAPWQARLDVDSPDLAWLGPLINADVASAGKARVELRLAGTPAQPLVSGGLHGEALALRLPAQGLRLENGRLEATLDGNRLRVARLVFDSPLTGPPRALLRAEGSAVGELAARPGQVEVAGEVQVDGGDLFLDVKLDRLGIFPGPNRWLAVSGGGRLDWREGRLGLAARVAADAGYWQLPRLDAPQLSDDVVVKRPGQSAPAAARSPLALDVEVDLGNHFRFSGAGLESRLSGTLKTTAAGHDLPRASGAIEAVDGRFEAYGQKLAIERGILNFTGLIDNPALDILAVREGLPVTPGVEVTGTMRRPRVRLVSDPDLPDAEKLSWLVLGRAPDQAAGTGDASLLLAAAGGLLGGESGGVVQQLKRNFGIEDIGVRTGQLGSDGRELGSQVVGNRNGATTAGAQIFSVGTRLSADTILTYEQALGTTESLVKLTHTLSRRLSLVGRVGSDNAVDLFYTFTFGR